MVSNKILSGGGGGIGEPGMGHSQSQPGLVATNKQLPSLPPGVRLSKKELMAQAENLRRQLAVQGGELAREKELRQGLERQIEEVMQECESLRIRNMECEKGMLQAAKDRADATQRLELFGEYLTGLEAGDEGVVDTMDLLADISNEDMEAASTLASQQDLAKVEAARSKGLTAFAKALHAVDDDLGFDALSKVLSLPEDLQEEQEELTKARARAALETAMLGMDPMDDDLETAKAEAREALEKALRGEDDALEMGSAPSHEQAAAEADARAVHGAMQNFEVEHDEAEDAELETAKEKARDALTIALSMTAGGTEIEEEDPRIETAKAEAREALNAALFSLEEPDSLSEAQADDVEGMKAKAREAVANALGLNALGPMTEDGAVRQDTASEDKERNVDQLRSHFAGHLKHGLKDGTLAKAVVEFSGAKESETAEAEAVDEAAEIAKERARAALENAVFLDEPLPGEEYTQEESENLRKNARMNMLESLRDGKLELLLQKKPVEQQASPKPEQKRPTFNEEELGQLRSKASSALIASLHSGQLEGVLKKRIQEAPESERLRAEAQNCLLGAFESGTLEQQLEAARSKGLHAFANALNVTDDPEELPVQEASVEAARSKGLHAFANALTVMDDPAAERPETAETHDEEDLRGELRGLMTAAAAEGNLAGAVQAIRGPTEVAAGEAAATE